MGGYKAKNSKTRRGRVGKQIANTLDVDCQQAVVLNPSAAGEVIQLNEAKEFGEQPQQQNRVYDPEGISPALQADMSGSSHKILDVKVAHVHRTEEAKSIRKETGTNPFTAKQIEFVENDVMNTIQTSLAKDNLMEVNKRIRRLTPLECFRLQGYPDTFVKPCSETQLYKQAGNSITVKVLKAIFKNMPLKNE